MTLVGHVAQKRIGPGGRQIERRRPIAEAMPCSANAIAKSVPGAKASAATCSDEFCRGLMLFHALIFTKSIVCSFNCLFNQPVSSASRKSGCFALQLINSDSLLNELQAYLIGLSSPTSQQTMKSFLNIVAATLSFTSLHSCAWGSLRRHHFRSLLEML